MSGDVWHGRSAPTRKMIGLRAGRKQHWSCWGKFVPISERFDDSRVFSFREIQES
jgi:hypothetical protein